MQINEEKVLTQPEPPAASHMTQGHFFNFFKLLSFFINKF